MNDKELNNLIAGRLKTGEDSVTEFKAQLDNEDSAEAEICAMLNHSGGVLLYGVKDDGCLSGLTDEELKHTSTRLTVICSERIRPPVALEIRNVNHEGFKLCVVIVPDDGFNKPYCSHRGEYWCRSGNSKRKLQSEELRRMASQFRGRSGDEQPLIPFDIDEINKSLLISYLDKHYSHYKYNTSAEIEETLGKIGLVSDGKINLAGFCLFAERESPRRPDLTIKMIHYRGNKRDMDFIDQRQASGNYRSQIDAAKLFLAQNLRQINASGYNTPESELDLAAVQEVIVNALLHREFGILSPILLILFSDRLEIISPGGLPNHQTPETASNGVSVPRNPVLVSHAMRMLPYRGTGQGLIYLKQKHPDAELIDDKVKQNFTVIIPRPVLK